MNRKYRKTVIAGNWKMNMLASEIKPFMEELRAAMPAPRACDVVLCTPAVMIPTMVKAGKEAKVAAGGQDVSKYEKGAYTGEVSAEMLTECGVEYVIVGHSERRQYFGETDETVNLRAKAALGAGLKVIICVGEMLRDREQGITAELVALQTKIALLGVGEEQLKNVIIAYEPVWAIGTGKTATAEQADEVCGIIRATVASLYGEAAAEALTVQYGGSMNAKNAEELLSKVNVDGGLIGGASLKPVDFSVIVDAAQK